MKRSINKEPAINTKKRTIHSCKGNLLTHIYQCSVARTRKSREKPMGGRVAIAATQGIALSKLSANPRAYTRFYDVYQLTSKSIDPSALEPDLIHLLPGHCIHHWWKVSGWSGEDDPRCAWSSPRWCFYTCGGFSLILEVFTWKLHRRKWLIGERR